MAQSSLNLIKQIVAMSAKGPGFGTVMNKMRVISAGSGQCSCELTVEESHQNQGGTLHGGLTATLVDVVSTYALMTTGTGSPGVSVDMNISYLRAAKLGEDIVVESQASKVGKTLAFLTVDIKRKHDGALVAQGRHTKFIGGS